MDMNLSKLGEIVEGRGAWHAAVHGVARVGHNLVTEEREKDTRLRRKPIHLSRY